MKQKVVGYIAILGILCVICGGYLSHMSSSSIISPTKRVLGISQNSQTSTLSTLITKVIDGDTIETSDGQKIRYIGINAPETGQPYGKEAADFNRQLVLHKEVTVIFDQQEKDQYNRLLGYVYVGNTFVNEEMVKNGWALAESISPDTLYQQTFESLEKHAKQVCLGLWSDLCMPVSDSCVKITTIHADASGIDDQNLNDEWVEIGNTCTNTIDLQGWLLKDSSATRSYTFADMNLLSGSFLKLHSGCGTNSFTDVFWQCPAEGHAIWNNSGDEAMLFDSHGKLLSVYKY